MNASLRSLRFVGLLAAAFIFADAAAAQDAPDRYKGYLGVFVVTGDGGMRIQRFIPNTPAELLALDGGIARNHTIVKLGGLPTRNLTELRIARDRIPEGQEAKMLLRGPEGVYHVWISRNEGGGYATSVNPEELSGANPGSPKPTGDYFKRGDVGEGSDQNFRPKGSGDVPATSPAPSNDGDFRPKK